MLLHHRTIGSSRSRIIVVPCVLTPQLPPCAIPHLTPDTLSILTLLAFHHSSAALSIPLSFPHPPSPILATFTSMTCVIKRFPRTTPRKLSLPCVKRGFLRTSRPHSDPKLSPCAPRCRSAMFMLCLAVMCHAPAPSHHRFLPLANYCRALFPTPQLPPCAIPHLTPDTLSILTLLACHPLPTRLSSLSSRTFHPFVVSTPAISNSSHDFFHGVRTKTFSTHVTT